MSTSLVVGAPLTVSRNRGSSRFTPTGRSLSVGFETNGKGFMGFIVELPGAFVRSQTEGEALSKVQTEASSYLKWSRNPMDPPNETLVVQRHNCKLQVEDGDCEILLDADRGVMSRIEFDQLAHLSSYSGETFIRLFEASEMKDWVDPARDRATFYGQAPRTIREIFDHVYRTQNYYLSRAGLKFPTGKPDDFLALRKYCMKQLRESFGRNGNSTIFNINNELWTLKKTLRRFIWHDRIHGKAIVRTLQKQRELGLISHYEDPFQFETRRLTN